MSSISKELKAEIKTYLEKARQVMDHVNGGDVPSASLLQRRLGLRFNLAIALREALLKEENEIEKEAEALKLEQALDDAFKALTGMCEICAGEKWVCENHPLKPWGDGYECCGGAGVACVCNQHSK